MKARVTSFVLALCLLCAPLLLTACTGFGYKRYQAESFAYFDTVTTVIGYAKNEKAFQAEADAIFSEFERYHRLFDIYHAYEGMENLYTVNEVQNGTHRAVTVDPCVTELLVYAKEMYAKTSGAFHVGMGSVLSIWHTHRENALAGSLPPTLPTESELALAATHTSLDNLEIDIATNTVYITDPAMTLDVGAIAKGYAAERVAQAMAARGVTGYLLTVGGTVRTVGSRADGKAWTAGIEDARENSTSPYLAEVLLTNQALSVSGNYQRYYTVNGVRYHHIIDTKTNQPAAGYLSVAVIAADTTLADVLSTALFCMDVERGEELLTAYPSVAVLWVHADGTLQKSTNFDAFLKK